MTIGKEYRRREGRRLLYERQEANYKKGARNYYTKEIIHSVVLLGFDALKMETVYFSETLVSSCESTRRQNTEQHRPPHRCENFTSQIIHI
jgi:ribosomal protein L4